MVSPQVLPWHRLNLGCASQMWELGIACGSLCPDKIFILPTVMPKEVCALKRNKQTNN